MTRQQFLKTIGTAAAFSAVEADAGTLHPTLIQDSNGNQITIVYDVGASSGAVNASSRITSISDPRGPSTYSFTYTSGHLASIAGHVGTPESYTFSYATQPLNSPFPPSISYGSIPFLQSVVQSSLGIGHSFQYDSTGTGEMTQVTTPLGGALQWQYRSFTYSGSLSLREVQSRSTSGGITNSWSFSHDDATDATQTYHGWTGISDAGAGTSKLYQASTRVAGMVTPLAYQEFNGDGSMPFYKLIFYTLDSAGTPYPYDVYTWRDYYTANNLQSETMQARDIYGNLLYSLVYDYAPRGATANLLRTFNNTYLSDPNYVSRYIRNRLTQGTVSDQNNVTTTLASNSYDAGALTDNPNLTYHDSSYNTGFHYRGNLASTNPANQSFSYDIGGVRLSSTDGAGRTVSSSTDSSTAYSLPAVLTPGGNGNLSTSISYASSWAVTSVIEPNGATSSTTYDAYGRPQTSTLADGAVTNYTYTYNPNTQTATISNPPENPSGTKWKRTTLDGFGRVTRVETGHDGTTVSTVDTQYAPCACSPLGKMYRVSQPYAPGATPVWTTYTYDGSGRTLTVTAPDGSVTRYSYQGNQTTVTDPAGKWKTTVTDAQGNLTQVIEPNPAGGANFVTTYTYDGMNHLTGVSMPRPTGTQTRTFVYTGPDLTSATNPENGTTTYTYNAAHQVLMRTDANRTQTNYTYDGYGRLTQVQHFGNGHNGDGWTNTYDTPIDSNFGATNTWGRLAAVQFGGSSPAFAYEYSYSAAGRITAQRMVATGLPSGQFAQSNQTLDATYTWDNEGRVVSEGYPAWGSVYTYGFDVMGRPNSLSVVNGYVSDGTVATAAYGPAGEMTSLSYDGYNETRTYNSQLQLTRQTVPGALDMEYVFPGGTNNGQISSSIDHMSGQQVNYTYDALKRLSAAATVSTAWGQAYTYDGFGNLTAKTVTQGTASNLAQAYDASTNHAIGNSGMTYDADGNTYFTGQSTGYDGENRLTQQGAAAYWYDPSGKRVLQTNSSSGDWTLYFYDIFGKRITNVPSTDTPANVAYFGSKPLEEWRRNGYHVAYVSDRLGSVRVNSNNETFSYLPYGEEQTSTPDNRVKFATYFRDSPSQDYADQRYYNSGYGRFNTADPSFKNIDLENPGSFNLYGYLNGDPVNSSDPAGLATYICDVQPFAPVCSGIGSAINGTDGPTDWINEAYWDAQPSKAANKRANKVDSTVWKALDVALSKLDSENCRSLFGNSSSPDPRDVLKGLLYGTSQYGNVTVNDIPDVPDQVTSATTKVSSLKPVDIGNGATQLVNATVLITINDLAGNFVNGDVNASAATLLHELGHAYNLLGALGGSPITPDGNDVAASEANQALVKKKCF